ncbi:MAG: Spy/CpxP family protein refolding chaperone [Candidatus Sericytochromatia bacterium]
MKKRLCQVAFSALIVFGVVSAPAFAEEPVQQTVIPSAKPVDMNKIWPLLGLSPDQSKAISEIRKKYDTEAAAFKQQLLSKQAELNRQLAAPASNPILLHRLMDENLALESRLKISALNSFIAMKGILTDAQKVVMQREIEKQQRSYIR